MRSLQTLLAVVFIASCCVGGVFAATKEGWRSRTIYQVLTDRFATSDGSAPPCRELDFKYCNGTWKGTSVGTFSGLQNKLDYIADMGFDAIWISPMTANTPNGYHGYWPLHFFEVNPRFGTEQDLKDLVQACHNRGIWVMFDMIANHIGYTDATSSTPFNRPEFFHRPCEVQDWNNQYQVEHCALAGLPDLNQTHPFVVEKFRDWISWISDTFNADGLRLDAVHHLRKEFWPEALRSSVPIFTIGEALKGDIGYVSSYSYYMDSVLNYPLYFKLLDVFVSRQTLWNLEWNFQDSARAYNDTSVLGNFIDNHDQPRFLNRRIDVQAYKAALTYVTFALGIPIIYYGSEQAYAGGVDPSNREPLWFSGYNNQAELYQFLKKIIAVRKLASIWNYPQEFRWSSSDLSVFICGNVTIALTNGGFGSSVSVQVPNLPYLAGEIVCNVFWPQSDCITIQSDGILPVILQNGETKIFVPKSVLEPQAPQAAPGSHDAPAAVPVDQQTPSVFGAPTSSLVTDSPVLKPDESAPVSSAPFSSVPIGSAFGPISCTPINSAPVSPPVAAPISRSPTPPASPSASSRLRVTITINRTVTIGTVNQIKLVLGLLLGIPRSSVLVNTSANSS